MTYKEIYRNVKKKLKDQFALKETTRGEKRVGKMQQHMINQARMSMRLVVIMMMIMNHDMMMIMMTIMMTVMMMIMMNCLMMIVPMPQNFSKLQRLTVY